MTKEKDLNKKRSKKHLQFSIQQEEKRYDVSETFITLSLLEQLAEEEKKKK